MAERSDWYAVYTKPRNEKKVADRLEGEGFEVYCPLQEQIRQWSDRKKKVKVPVLPSYVFVRVDLLRERERMMRVPGIVQLVYWLGKPAVVREEELTQLRAFLEEYEEVRLFQSVQKGDEVSIEVGMFKGRNGIVENTTKKRAILRIPSIGIELVAHVRLDKLKRINTQA